MNKKKIMVISYALISAFCGYIFISRIIFSLIASLIGAYIGLKKYKEKTIQMEINEERREFLYLAENFSASIMSGKNIIEALQNGHEDLNKLFKNEKNKHSGLTYSIGLFLLNQKNGEILGTGLYKLSRSCKDKLVASFFERLEAAVKQGADLALLSRTYYRLLTEEEKLRSERLARLDAAIREQALLFSMPIVILLLMKWTGLISNNYRFLDYLARLISLILFYIAYLWSKAILRE